ncbi:ABC-2 transporter permease [Alkalicella caledoniensis]|uniref:ABC-2 transporter permease n=1 Tax=Alkalicella caledoniensis TaxID=2731377 RepID=A0A7G9W5S7_ALKCA|nr:ABC-2 transporter permease [Alkalicella caledoniensis]QNO14039.1 ABC-2 transporter permease [Alkalicella caledoniensis]
MKGLILKDLMNLRKQGKVYMVAIVFYSLMAFATGDASMLGTMLFLFCTMVPVTAMAFDERAQWDKYGLSMPISRREIVISKYLLGIMCSSLGLVLIFLLNKFLPSDAGGNVKGILALFGLSIVVLSMILPIQFKFGVEKGRILVMLVFFLPAAIFIFFTKLDISHEINIAEVIEFVGKALPLIASLALASSMGLSMRIYRKKEL